MGKISYYFKSWIGRTVLFMAITLIGAIVYKITDWPYFMYVGAALFSLHILIFSFFVLIYNKKDYKQ